MTAPRPDLPPAGVIHTNPVYVLQTFSNVPRGVRALLAKFDAAGVELSAAARRFVADRGAGAVPPPDTPPAAPGVVGLVYCRPDGPAFVTPLVAREVGTDWEVAPNLPFRAPALCDFLARLLRAAGAGLAELDPYFFAFDVRDRAGINADGSSMTIAGLLAVLVARAGDRDGLFRAACAVVQPGEDDELVSVGRESVAAKLDAFVREYTEGTLLVRPTDCPEADPFDRHFRSVWRVDSFAALAAHAEQAGVLAAFRRQTPLSRRHFEQARDRLVFRANVQHRYQETLPLAQQLLEHPLAPDVPPGCVDEVRRLVHDLLRHLGRYNEAVESATRELRRLERNRAQTCYDERARAGAVLASSLFDAHRFGEARALLNGWYDLLRADPELVSPAARVMVFNTLARTETIYGGDWEEKFKVSLALQQATDPPGRARTFCYLAHARLRHGRLTEAERAIREGERCSGANDFSHWMLAFAHADLARRSGMIWSDPVMDRRPVGPGEVGHPFGIYLQASARQNLRRQEDRIDRLNRAAEFFEADVAGSKERNLASFLASCVRLRAVAEVEDATAWAELCRKLGRYLRGRKAKLVHHYWPAWEDLGSIPAVGPVEKLLALVPYF